MSLRTLWCPWVGPRDLVTLGWVLGFSGPGPGVGPREFVGSQEFMRLNRADLGCMGRFPDLKRGLYLGFCWSLACRVGWVRQARIAPAGPRARAMPAGGGRREVRTVAAYAWPMSRSCRPWPIGVRGTQAGGLGRHESARWAGGTINAYCGGRPGICAIPDAGVGGSIPPVAAHCRFDKLGARNRGLWRHFV